MSCKLAKLSFIFSKPDLPSGFVILRFFLLSYHKRTTAFRTGKIIFTLFYVQFYKTRQVKMIKNLGILKI